MSAILKRVYVETLLKVTGIRYATFLCILLALQACQPVDDITTDSAGISSDGVSTLRLAAPKILQDTRAVDAASLGVEVNVSYMISGTNYQRAGVATRSGSAWEFNMAVPRNTPFEIRMTWFNDGTPRLDLVRITRSSAGFSDNGRLTFSQDFSSADNFSNRPDAQDYAGFDDDGDDQSNLLELINGTDPFTGNLIDEPEQATLILQTTTLPLTASLGAVVSSSITVANEGDLLLDYSIESDSDWLTVSPTAGQIAGRTSAGVELNASCGSTVETRSGVLTFTGNGGRATVSILLTCESTPQEPPVLTILTTQLPLTATADRTASDVLTLENTGRQPLEYSIESDRDWLIVSPTGGQIVGGTSEDLQVRVICGSTSETRSGTVTIRSNGGNGTVAVQLTCNVGPRIDLPLSLAVNLNALTNEIATDTISLGNSGDAELSYSFSSDATWLTVLPQQGAIAAGETLDVQISGACGAGLSEVSDNLTLQSNGGNAEFAIGLRCTGGPALSDVRPASLGLAIEISQVTQSSIFFTNSGNDILDYTLQTDEGWLCLSEDDEQLCATGATTLSGQLAAGATNTILVFATCADVTQTFTGLINLSTNGGSDQNIPVVLDCVQSASPSGLIVSASVDGSTGTFVTGIPPAAVGAITLTPFDNDAFDTIISGGSIEIRVIADQPFSRLYVVTEPEGYFDILLPESESNASLILTASTKLENITESDIIIQAESPIGSVSVGQMFTVSTLEVLTGDLQVNVTWDRDADVDLILMTPSGQEIYYGNQVVGNGTLDLDSNAFCSSGPRAENISFGDSDAPPGQYTVSLSLFSACGLSVPMNFVVTVRANGMTETFTGSFEPTDGSTPRVITTVEVR